MCSAVSIQFAKKSFFKTVIFLSFKELINLMEILNFIIKFPQSLYYLLNVTHWLTAILVFGLIVLATCFRPHSQQFGCKITQAWHVVSCYHVTEANHKPNYVFGRKNKKEKHVTSSHFKNRYFQVSQKASFF